MTRVDPRAMAFLSDKPGPGPETLHIDLINTCNFDCIYCWHYSPLRASPPEREWKLMKLPTRVAITAIQDVAELGTPRILFSGGGEPLLHPGIYTALELCAELHLKTTLISNLWVADLDRLSRYAPEKILANCSAATEPTYLATHPNRHVGDWDRFQKRLRMLSTVSRVTLVFVVTRHNVMELGSVLDLASRLGAVRVQYKLADLHGSLARATISEADRTALQAQLPNLRARAEELGIETTLDAFERELKGARMGLDFVQRIGCYVGWYYARISADGGVYACCKNVPIGHLGRMSFAQIWRGRAYQEFRALTRARDFSRWPQACTACGNLSLNVRAKALLEKAVSSSRSAHQNAASDVATTT
ncbi:MAG: radical SAM protein [Nitrospinae bacterium]|nr:radical SAM protein [Nitrospinota bacterium]